MLLFGFIFLSGHLSYAQKRNASYEEYIRQYASLAIEHQHQYKIPASITLAQGILESGAGKSQLARESNNHFGIKCHAGWEGKRVYKKDDIERDCFRVYASVKDSYEDHSLFLTERKRYSRLFTYRMTDYKKWARGLQDCGYATDKGYANSLIKLIEDYELYIYDKETYIPGQSLPGKDKKKKEQRDNPVGKERIIQKRSGLKYVTVSESDDLYSIAQDTGHKLDDLLKYNEVNADFPLQPGDIIYLQKKKSKADKPYFDHEVQVGESMYSIAQNYGIKVSSLYKINKKSKDYVPAEGDVLRLR